MDTSAYKKCEYIIRRFMAVDKPSPELRAQFHQWLLSERHCREKNSVLFNLFYEALSDENHSKTQTTQTPPADRSCSHEDRELR